MINQMTYAKQLKYKQEDAAYAAQAKTRSNSSSPVSHKNVASYGPLTGGSSPAIKSSSSGGGSNQNYGPCSGPPWSYYRP